MDDKKSEKLTWTFSLGKLKMYGFLCMAFNPKMISPWSEAHELYNFLISLSHKSYIPHLVNISLVDLETKILTDDARRTKDVEEQTKTDDNQ